jgi:hypothetical protein
MIVNYNFERSKKYFFFVLLIYFNRLNSGWSFHTNRPVTNRVTTPITPTNINQSLRDEEIERIKKVLERAQRIELLEQERIG